MDRAVLLVFAATAALLSGCKGRDDAKPQRVTENPVIAPPKRPERTGPFRTPRNEPPPPRSEPQLAPEELAKTIAEAKEAERTGDAARVAILLRRCANKVPQSIECEGRLALALLPERNYKAEAEYYLAEAIRGEGAHPVDLDRKLAEAAVARGRSDLAAQAYARVVASEEATAEDWVAFARALSTDHARLSEAVDAYGKAIELRADPSWIHEQAVVLGQLGRSMEAIAAFEAFIRASGGKDPELERKARLRIEELRTGRTADLVPSKEGGSDPKSTEGSKKTSRTK